MYGETGTGKSVSMNKLLRDDLDSEKYMSLFLNFSAQTSANQTQDIIDGKLDKRRRGIYGPPIGKKCVIFVDDLNMPAKEEYGAQPPIEILRQWMDHKGWYDRKEVTFRNLVDIQFVAAMGPPGGGRTRITQRYVRHFTLLTFVPFDHDSQGVIFSAIINWALRRHAGNVRSMGASLVAATLEMYDSVSEEMLPTPAKSHYTYNLRDLSKVFQGIVMSDAKSIKDPESMIKLWGHECTRVFHDRLSTVDDRNWFLEIWQEKSRNILSGSGLLFRNMPLMFGRYTDPEVLPEHRVYTEVESIDDVKRAMGEYMEDYNSMSSTKMNLVLFLNAIEHISRICRVITQPLGNALLVGVGGSGRKSLTMLATSICDLSLFQIEITKVYGMVEWREDLKRLLRMAGVDGKGTVFLFSDTQIVYEGFVEDINNILNAGEVPNLFLAEERQAIVEEVRIAGEKEGKVLLTSQDVMAYFVERRSNLHIVLALHPLAMHFEIVFGNFHPS